MDTAPYPEAQPAHRTMSLPSVGARTVSPSDVTRLPLPQSPSSKTPPETSNTNWLPVSDMRAVSSSPDVYVPPQVWSSNETVRSDDETAESPMMEVPAESDLEQPLVPSMTEEYADAGASTAATRSKEIIILPPRATLH